MADIKLEGDTVITDDEPLILDTPEPDGANEPEDGDDLSIEIEGEEQSDEPDLVKHLRAVARDAQRELAEERKAKVVKVDPGPEPTLEGCEYDEDRFKDEWVKWNRASQEAEQASTAESRQQQQQSEVFQKSFTNYRAKAQTLGVKDFDAAEESVVGVLPQTVQAAIIQYMNDPAKLVYALGKHPAKLAEIAAEPDQLKQILMLRDLEKKVVVNRKKPPAAEASSIPRGSAPLSGNTVDKEEQRLEKEAERTNDYSALFAHQRSKRKAKSA